MKVKELLKEHGIEPNKRLGQSFLVSENIATRIVEVCEIMPDDVIVEVGAGLGILTEQLCACGNRVLAIEKDPMLFEFLVKRFKDAKNLTILNKDILSLKLSTLKFATLKLISNLPYSITSDFLYWVLGNRNYIHSCVITLQREVASRIYAKPGTKSYGAISVVLQFCMEIKPLFLIHGNYFFPKSKVMSQVILLKPKPLNITVNERSFFKIVRTAFARRRKQLKNSLNLKVDVLGGIDLSRRPETLGCEEFIRLTNAID